MKLVAIVGMTGAGKSEVSRLFEKGGYIRIRFGDITDEEIRKRDLELNEENERRVREALRKEHGMAAYALLNLSRIDLALKQQDVVIDGLYSWEEYILLKNYFDASLTTMAVWSSPQTRYARLTSRDDRPLTIDEATSRDRAEVEKLNKAGPIAIADITLINESSLRDLAKEVKVAITFLRKKH
jgi:dephospho-CoA kinase